jgi:hypothetical protein
LDLDKESRARVRNPEKLYSRISNAVGEVRYAFQASERDFSQKWFNQCAASKESDLKQCGLQVRYKLGTSKND